VFRSFRDEEVLGVRDLIFLRDAVQSDYFAARGEFYAQKLFFLHHDRNMPTITSFDYIRGRPPIKVEIVPRSGGPRQGAVDVARWTDLASRVTRSGGKMDLHFVQVRDGSQMRLGIFRMRFAHSQVHDELLALATTVPAAPRGHVAHFPSRAARNSLRIGVLMAYQNI